MFVTWDGAVTSSDYMVMQQGLVVHLDLGTKSEEVPLGVARAQNASCVRERRMPTRV